ncbi:MAG: nucleotide pyrophosphohydrolase [Butyrivibrio sp.]|nr:nucleotide pyrophosphohydrolase [Butyrivibrio sp.]
MNSSESNNSKEISKISTLQEISQISRLKEIVQKLRSEEGCEWDKAQTHSSLKATCIEEAAEVIGGINILEKTGNCENLREELGDLLLQVMFHAVIAEEEGLFTFEDVAKTISDKMIRRHPHVFGDMKYASREELHKAWAEIKRKEKEGREWEEDYLEDAFNESIELIGRAKERKGFTE